MAIPAAAWKCPHCQHFQTWSVRICFHPATAVLLACLPLLGVPYVFEHMFDPGESFERYQGRIQVVDSRIECGETRNSDVVAVIGTVTNGSAVPWKEIHFHVDFTDAAGVRTDVGQKEEYSRVLPPHAALAFKGSFRREFPQTNYMAHTVRVISAKDARARF